MCAILCHRGLHINVNNNNNNNDYFLSSEQGVIVRIKIKLTRYISAASTTLFTSYSCFSGVSLFCGAGHL